MTSRLEQLMMAKISQQQEASRAMANDQMESLHQKQSQIKQLEEKLAALEALQDEDASISALDNDSYSTLNDPIEIRHSFQQSEPVQTNADIMAQYMQDPLFAEKILELQRQSAELAYLEDQLATMRALKTKLHENQEMMAAFTEQKDGFKKTALEPIEEVDSDECEVLSDHDVAQDTSEPVREPRVTQAQEDIKQEENDEEEHLEDTNELLRMIQAMTEQLAALETKSHELSAIDEKQSKLHDAELSFSPEEESVILDQLMQRLYEASVNDPEAFKPSTKVGVVELDADEGDEESVDYDSQLCAENGADQQADDHIPEQTEEKVVGGDVPVSKTIEHEQQIEIEVLQRAASRASNATTTRRQTLFEKNKRGIYQNAAAVISAFETQPFFLTTLFKKVEKIGVCEVAQQKLMLFLDGLESEIEQDCEEFWE